MNKLMGFAPIRYTIFGTRDISFIHLSSCLVA